MEKIDFKSAKEKINSSIKILGLLAVLGGNTESAVAGNSSPDLELLKNRAHVAENRIQSSSPKVKGDYLKSVEIGLDRSVVFIDSKDGLFIKEILDEDGKKVTAFLFDRRDASSKKLEGDPHAMLAVEGNTDSGEDKVIESSLASAESEEKKISLQREYTAFFKTSHGGIIVDKDGNQRQVLESDTEYKEAIQLMREHYDTDVTWVATEEE